MAYMIETKNFGRGERMLPSLSQIFRRVALMSAHYRVYRQTLNELRALNDRELNDIGMNRTMLSQVARDAADMAVKL